VDKSNLINKHTLHPVKIVAIFYSRKPVTIEKPDRCVPDWQCNAADSGSNASVSCAPGIPALFQKQQKWINLIL
jgi:hypothetical protein